MYIMVSTVFTDRVTTSSTYENCVILKTMKKTKFVESIKLN